MTRTVNPIKDTELKIITNNFAQVVENAGLKLTKPRIALAKALEESTDHPDAGELIIRTKLPTCSVYRNLRLFEEHDLIERVEFDDGRARFEIKKEIHGHLVDVSTGQIVEFDNVKLKAYVAKLTGELGYDLLDYKIQIYATPSKKKESKK